MRGETAGFCYRLYVCCPLSRGEMRGAGSTGKSLGEVGMGAEWPSAIDEVENGKGSWKWAQRVRWKGEGVKMSVVSAAKMW